MPWVHYVLSLILFMHNTKGRKQTSNWQKDNNCSETCPQSVTIHCEGKVWQTATSAKILCSHLLCHSFWPSRRENYRQTFFLCLAIFPFDFLEHNCLQKVIIKISWVFEESIFMTRPSQRDFLKHRNMRLNKTAAIASKLFVFEMRLTNWNPNSLFHLQVWFISIPLLCLEENIISEDWLMDVLGSKFSGKHQFKIITGWQWNSSISPPPRSPQKITRVDNDRIGVWWKYNHP